MYFVAESSLENITIYLFCFNSARTGPRVVTNSQLINVSVQVHYNLEKKNLSSKFSCENFVANMTYSSKLLNAT